MRQQVRGTKTIPVPPERVVTKAVRIEKKNGLQGEGMKQKKHQETAVWVMQGRKSG